MDLGLYTRQDIVSVFSIKEKRCERSVETYASLSDFAIIENAIQLMVLTQRTNIIDTSAPEPLTEDLGVRIR